MRKTKWPLSSNPNTSTHTNLTDLNWKSQQFAKSCSFKTTNFFGIWQFWSILWQFLQKNRVCQNQPLPDIGAFEANVLFMKVTLVNGNHNAHNIISITSKESWGWRLKWENSCFSSKIGPISKQPLNGLRQKIAIIIRYLNKNELIWEVWGQFDLKWPQNYKLKLGWARAKSQFFCKNSHRIPKNCQISKQLVVLKPQDYGDF